jgi:ABC-type dipeptide/oligopeptide/nickel transport system ATPase component
MVEYGDAAQICNAPRDSYTQTLLAATPEIRIAQASEPIQ